MKLYRSSGNAELDDAAIEAVKDADLPAAVPEGLENPRHFVISVRFAPRILAKQVK